MVDIATPKKMPGRRQKELRKVAKQRIKEAKSDGDDVIAKMNENVLKWKRVAEIGLEKMAMEQDVMITNAEQKLEDLQEAAKATALVCIHFLPHAPPCPPAGPSGVFARVLRETRVLAQRS